MKERNDYNNLSKTAKKIFKIAEKSKGKVIDIPSTIRRGQHDLGYILKMLAENCYE